MPFLVIHVMYSCIGLIMDAMFWHNDIHIDLKKFQSSYHKQHVQCFLKEYYHFCFLNLRCFSNV
jgi:hypothetical protein